MLPILTILALSLIGVIADYFIKLAGSTNSRTLEIEYFIAGLVIYAATAFGWFYVMRHIKFATLGALYAISTVIMLVIVGVFFFKEQLHPMEIVGIGLAVVSLILLARFA